MVAVCGVTVATAALICALSIMNGFNDLVFSMFSNFDPELKILPKTGKVFQPDPGDLSELKTLPEISLISEVVQDYALIRYNDRQVVATVKGVDDQYLHLTQLNNVLIDGEFKLRDEVAYYATLGIGLAYELGVNTGFVFPLELYAPRRDETINPANPVASLNLEYAYISSVYRIDQQLYDEGFMIVPIALARSLFSYEEEVSAWEIKLNDEADVNDAKNKIKALLGDDYQVLDRYEQQSDALKMMQSEKWMIFLILCFILTIALFNMVGSLSMLMIEKQEDVRTLRNMGADDLLIRRIFLFEGWMIAGFGALAGMILGLILCLLQQEFGLIKMGTEGAFVIANYPVRIVISDLFIVFFTVLTLGFLSAWYPVYYLGDRWLKKK